MDVPVQAGAAWEMGVDGGKEVAGEDRREVGANEVVEEGGEEEFVDVQGKGGEGEGVRKGGRRADEERGWGEGERVVHVCYLVVGVGRLSIHRGCYVYWEGRRGHIENGAS